MDISKRTAVILGVATLALVLAATAWASSLPSAPGPGSPAVVQDIVVRVGPSVNLTPDDPAVPRGTPTSPAVTPPTTTPEPPSTEPTHPTTPDPTTPSRHRILRPVPTDGRTPAAAPEEYEPLDPQPALPPIDTTGPTPTP
jgi:hypothetical protein